MDVGKDGLTIPLLVVIAVGIHCLGEGAAYGAPAFSTSSASLLNAFGGLSAGVAYVLHKGLEPMMAGACYSFYNKAGAGTVCIWLRSMFFLSIVFLIPSLLRYVTGYLAAYDTTHLFTNRTSTASIVV